MADPSQHLVNGVAAPSPQAAPTDRGCPGTGENRQSALCASWKAVDAGRDSADYALISAILAFVGMLLLAWTLFYTRKANRIAMDGRRPSVSIDVEPRKVRLSEMNMTYLFDVILTNLSSTPVVNLTLRDEVEVLPVNPHFYRTPDKRFPPVTSAPSVGVILPHGQLVVNRATYGNHSGFGLFRLTVTVDFQGDGDGRTWQVSRSFKCDAKFSNVREDLSISAESMSVEPEEYIRVV